jgi:3-methylfumaryl-CoA hydratase
MAAATTLAAAVDGWAPGPVTSTDVIDPWPAAAFSALLDLPAPVAGMGEPLPPLWHWLHFLEHPRRSELGEDGHPADGHFLPPVPDRRRMFAGGRLRVHAPIRVGDRVERRTELVGVTPKSGRSGEMLFITTRHEFRRDGAGGGELLLTEEQDIVYRSQPAGVARAADPPEPEHRPAPDHRWRIELPTDPALLFRFSALTYNTHRIHYDQPYATGVEGYPGLVVHGPLLALLLLEIPRRELPGAAVAGFDFRLSRPAFSGGSVVATGEPDGDRIALRAGAAGSGESISGGALIRR